MTAYHYSSYPCEVCVSPQPAVESTPVKTGVFLLPPIENIPQVEYGFLLQQVSGPESLSIRTQNVSSISTTQVTIRVGFENGTAAQGA